MRLHARHRNTSEIKGIYPQVFKKRGARRMLSSESSIESGVMGDNLRITDELNQSGKSFRRRRCVAHIFIVNIS